MRLLAGAISHSTKREDQVLRLQTVVAVALLVSTSAASAQFMMDQSAAEMRKNFGKFAVSDLAVGETGILSYATWCAKDGQLFTGLDDLLDDTASDYGVNMRVRRLPGNAVSFDMHPAKQSTTSSARNVVLLKLLNAPPCSYYEPYGRSFISVAEINGARSVTEALDKIK